MTRTMHDAPAPDPAPVQPPTVTTETTTTTTVTPACGPSVPWYRSQRFIALCQSTAVLMLGWLSQALATDDWSSWKALVIAVLGNLLVALKDWFNPNVVAPFAALNRNNTVPVVKP